jgi:hypothetical protein
MATSSLEDILATRVRQDFLYRVNFKKILEDNIPLMEEWCQANCQDKWRKSTYFIHYWQFESEIDATMFTLRWGSYDGNHVG